MKELGIADLPPDKENTQVKKVLALISSNLTYQRNCLKSKASPSIISIPVVLLRVNLIYPA